MATGPQFTAALAPMSGLHEATFDRYMRYLMASGIIRKSGKGGGRSAIHLNSNEAASILLALAAPQPNGAASAVRRLGPMRSERALKTAKVETLMDRLANSIGDFEVLIRRGKVSETELGSGKWELSLCLDPLTAWSSLMIGGKERVTHFLDPQADFLRPVHPQDVHRGVRRLTVITADVLLIAAKLCADSKARERRGMFPDLIGQFRRNRDGPEDNNGRPD